MHTWAFALFTLLYVMPGMVGHEPWKQDETYIVEIVRSMVASQDFLVPTMAGEAFMEKPPLFYWVAAGLARLLSPVLSFHDAARLATALFLLMTCTAVAYGGRRWRDRDFGRTAVLVLLGCIGMQAYAQAQAPVEMAPRKKAERKPLPAHLPREERLLRPALDACPDCGGNLKTLGEDVSEQLEYVPASFRVIRHVRPKLACACCDRIVQAPAASRPIERGLPGPGLLAHVLVAKYADHVPLYRQSVIYAREGVELERSLLASWVGAASALLRPLSEALRRHVFAAAKLHADDTPLPVLAPGNGKTRTARLWTYVRDDRASGATEPPAVWFAYSPDRKGEHPQAHLAGFSGVLQADAYAGFNAIYESGRVAEAACWAHARRKFYDLHAARPSALTAEALRRIGELYAIEEAIRGKPPDERLAERQARARPLLDDLERWLQTTLATLSRKSDTAAAILYALKLWPALTRYANDGRIEIDNSAAERALRGVALGRRNFLFAGADSGGERAAAIYGLIGTARLNGIDPEAWLRHVLERMAEHPVNRVHDFLPWNLADTLATTPVT